MSAQEFGRELIISNDLDPVYVLLHAANLSDGILKKWLIAYWCFYHAGTASWIADVNSEVEFWRRMRTAAGSKEYPRCPERRHFRGENARKSVEWLSGQGIETLIDGFPRPDPTAADVIEYVSEWVGFGPWISFKVADMLERLGLLAVRFDLKTVMYDSPAAGAERMWEETYPDRKDSPPLREYSVWAANRLLTDFSNLTAPPQHERLIGLQEIETVLCKWNSYRKGHYELGEDIHSLERALRWYAPSGGCLLTKALHTIGRDCKLW